MNPAGLPDKAPARSLCRRMVAARLYRRRREAGLVADDEQPARLSRAYVCLRIDPAVRIAAPVGGVCELLTLSSH